MKLVGAIHIVSSPLVRWLATLAGSPRGLALHPSPSQVACLAGFQHFFGPHFTLKKLKILKILAENQQNT
jgi:hypothetical protein